MALSTPASGTRLGGRLAAPRRRRGGARRRDDRGRDRRSRSSSLWRDAWRRLLRNRLAMAGGVVVVLLALVAIFADVLVPYPYTKTNFGRLNEAPLARLPAGDRRARAATCCPA